MWLILFFLVLFAGTAEAQLAVNINTANLAWQWTQGAPPNDGMPDEFRVKCGAASKTYSRITSVAPTARSIPMRQAITGSGSWYCVVTAANQVAESGPSNEVSFFAGAPPSGPSGLEVVAQ